MLPLRSIVLLAVAVLGSFALSACGEDKDEERPIPTPVPLTQQPDEGFTLGDPSVEALPGADAEFGQLGGTIYQIEIPKDWNGRLVMYIHGNEPCCDLQVYPPIDRAYLIENGVAWAASSFSVNFFNVSGQAAEDTAALWDFFVQKHGRPERTYVMGESMGGAATVTSAERYGDRYDGALALCGDEWPVDTQIDFYAAGAFASGVTQAEFDSANAADLVSQRIRPALFDPARREVFEDVLIDINGGPRPFDREGIRLGEDIVWETAIANVAARLFGNDQKTYELGPSAGVSSDEFNEKVIRIKKENSLPHDVENEMTGDLQIPLVTMQSTGDIETFFNDTQELRRRIEGASKGDLLVQRAIRDPRHCGDHGFTLIERQAALNDLIAWVEDGDKPDGEDLLSDVSGAGGEFTLAPRIGLPEAEDVPGADDRVTLHGTLTFDGQPLTNGILFGVVRKDGMLRLCSYMRPWIMQGTYEMQFAADNETPGCGAAGAQVFLVLFREGERYIATEAVDWPKENEVTFNALFSSARPRGAAIESSVDEFFGTGFYGSAFDAEHEFLPVGTPIEAYIDDTLCGRYAVPPVVLEFEDQGTYQISIASETAVPGCTKNAPVTFRINGKEAPQTGTNDLASGGRLLVLTAP